MGNRFQAAILIGSLVALAGCAAPSPKRELPGAPAEAGAPPGNPNSVEYAPGAVIGTLGETIRENRDARDREGKAAGASITLDCAVKLPADPTDNLELCRSFQLTMVDEAGRESARFRFGGDGRYRFAAKPGKRYRVKPVLGKNWEFSVDPDRPLAVGERARVQLRQKE